ncbi:MAG: hypothetical protein ACRD82_19670 [Blastocatellia bacterium]
MADEPIIIKPGVYTLPGKPKVMGLCIVIDDQEAGWLMADKADGSITINIPSESPWKVMRVPDEDGSGYYLQIFRIDGKLNSIVLESFMHPTDDVHTPNADHPADKPPALQIHYTKPEGTGGHATME